MIKRKKTRVISLMLSLSFSQFFLHEQGLRQRERERERERVSKGCKKRLK